MDQKTDYIQTNSQVTVELSPVIQEHPASIAWDEVDSDEQEYLDRLATAQGVS